VRLREDFAKHFPKTTRLIAGRVIMRRSSLAVCLCFTRAS
jgi:hypothetical protein